MRDDLVHVVQLAVNTHIAGVERDYCNPQDFIGIVNAAGELADGLAGVADDELHMVAAMCWLGANFTDIPPAVMRERLLRTIRELEPDEGKRLHRIMECAIAFGCGKWRVLAAERGSWGARWPQAVQALARAMTPAIRRVPKGKGQHYQQGIDSWLAETVWRYPPKKETQEIQQEAATLAQFLCDPELPLALEADHALRIDASADGIVIRTVAGTPYETWVPPGAKFVFRADTPVQLLCPQRDPVTVPSGVRVVVLVRGDDVWITPDVDAVSKIQLQVRQGQLTTVQIPGPAKLGIWHCTCGNTNCLERHRLAGWDPRKVLLWAFVASAVKGPHCTLRLGSAVQGMYLPMLAREGQPRVREVDVEMAICPCGEKYEGDICRSSECTAGPFDPGRMRRVSERRLVVDGVDPPAYLQVRRQRCGNRDQHYRLLNGLPPDSPVSERLGSAWDNHFQFSENGDAARCPLCGRVPQKPRPTCVCVRYRGVSRRGGRRRNRARRNDE